MENGKRKTENGKRKTIKNKVSLVLITLFTFTSFFGCENSLENNDFKLDSDIGENHNNILSDFYGLDSNGKSTGVENDFDSYFGECEVVVLEDSNSTSNLVEQLENKSFLEGNSAYYMKQVEDILNSPSEDLLATLELIVEIENDAKLVLVDNSLTEFLSYSETAKASLSFWNSNYAMLSGIDVERGSWWAKYKHKIAMAAASDAAGAAAGAVAGAAIGASIAGVGAGPGALIGASIAGAASSVKGFQTDSLCIFVPVSKIENQIK